MTTLQEFYVAREEYEKVKLEVSQKYGELLEAQLVELFAEIPKLESISWTQFTDYFNDGEECLFRVNTGYPRISYQGYGPGLRVIEADEEEPDEDEDDYEEEFDIAYELELFHYDGWQARLKPQDLPDFRKIRAFLDTLDDDILESAFGDHARIVCTRESGINVEEYTDHS